MTERRTGAMRAPEYAAAPIAFARGDGRGGLTMSPHRAPGVPAGGPHADAVASAALAAAALLLDAPDGDGFAPVLERAIEGVARAGGFQRAALVARVDASAAPGTECWSVVAEWHAPEVAAWSLSPYRRGAMTDAPDWLARLLAGEPVLAARTEELRDARFRAVQSALGVRYVVSANIVLHGASWGALRLDDCASDRARTPAELAALASAARVVGAAVHRHRERARSAEAARGVAARAADERAAVLAAANAQLAKRLRLVEAAVASADTLLAAPVVADAMAVVLERLGSVLHADRAILMRFEPPEPDGPPSTLGWGVVVREWTAPGVPRQSDDPALARLDLDHYADAVRRLRTERSVELRTHELPDVGRAEQEATGARSQVVLAVMVRGELWGFLGFDDCRDARTWDEAEIGLMLIVTASLGGALEREALAAERLAAEREVLAERERAAEARAAELARVNEALRAPVAALARGDGVAGLLASALRGTCAHAGADHSAVFLHDAATDTLRLLAACDGTRVERPADAAWLAPWRAPLAASTSPAWAALSATPEAWLAPPHDDAAVAGTTLPWPGALGLHAHLGHARFGYLRLEVGGTPLGMLALAWRDATPAPGRGAWTVLTALAQQLALALELDRLAQRARAEAGQAAALEERARLAREVHDTVAQGLAGIVMQLKAARRRLGEGAWSGTSPLALAARIADEALAEARRAITVLRPGVSDGEPADLASAGALPAGLERIAAAVRAEHGVVVRMGIDGPVRALPPGVAFECLRIAQAALANAAQHAQARAVAVSLEFGVRPEEGVRLAVVDDGRGFDATTVPTGRFGLVGMRERAARIGASLSVVTAAGEGTRVFLRWPGEDGA